MFTTHTVVAAGFDCFSPDLIDHWLGKYASAELGISVSELLSLGQQNSSKPTDDFNMAYLAIHSIGTVNGVSALHGKVSRQLCAPLLLS